MIYNDTVLQCDPSESARRTFGHKFDNDII